MVLLFYGPIIWKNELVECGWSWAKLRQGLQGCTPLLPLCLSTVSPMNIYLYITISTYPHANLIQILIYIWLFKITNTYHTLYDWLWRQIDIDCHNHLAFSCLIDNDYHIYYYTHNDIDSQQRTSKELTNYTIWLVNYMIDFRLIQVYLYIIYHI